MEGRVACGNKQVVIGKKTNKQILKNNSKTVGRWDTKGVIVIQVGPTDSAINYREKKMQIKTKKINQFLLSSRGCLYRTKDNILLS